MKLIFTLFLLFAAACTTSSDEVTSFWDSYDSRKEPLNVEIVRQWENDKGSFMLIRYDLGKLNGTNKSASPKIAAYYGFPKDAGKVPGVVQIHGGGQRASLSRVETWVNLGMACISINWGAKVLEKPDTPNTDWDGIAAGFIRPGITKADELDHHNLIRPDKNTLYKEPHLLNSSWNLIAMSARRALTFLEQRPEVDKEKLGVEGHSMGGRSTVLTAIDPRIKAASPSVGGSGFLYQDIWGLKGSARRMRNEDGLDLYQKTVSAQAYWPHIKAPILFLGATDDFNSPAELVIKGMKLLPEDTDSRLAMAPHFNHRFDTGTDNARFLWMISRLKGDFDFPKESKASLKLDNENGIPVLSVDIDRSTPHKVKKVDLYYGFARDPRIRFWRSAKAAVNGNTYSAHIHVFDINEPLFAFANVTYRIDRKLPSRPGRRESDILTVSSNYIAVYPDDLKKSGVKETAKRMRLIDDFSRGFQDWYTLSPDNPDHWCYATRKIVDPSWMGPRDSTLEIELETSAANNRMAITLDTNRWQGYTGRRPDSFYAVVQLKNKGINKVSLKAADFKNSNGQALKDWDEVNELLLTPSNRIKGPRVTKETWQGKPPVMKRLLWAGGKMTRRPYPHQPRGNKTAAVKGFEKEFQKAIDDSVELEKKDEELHKK